MRICWQIFYLWNFRTKKWRSSVIFSFIFYWIWLIDIESFNETDLFIHAKNVLKLIAYKKRFARINLIGTCIIITTLMRFVAVWSICARVIDEINLAVVIISLDLVVRSIRTGKGKHESPTTNSGVFFFFFSYLLVEKYE